MKTKVMPFLLITLVAFTASAQQVELPARADARTWIGASVVRDDGSALVTVISQKPRRTDLVRIAPNGKTETTVIEGMAINSLREVGPRRNLLLVGASVDRGSSAAYAHRLVEWTPQGLRTIWDSLALGEAIVSREPAVTVNDSGTGWAAAAQTGNSGFKVWLGDTSSNTPRRTFSISLTPPSRVPEQFAADGFGVALVADDVPAVLFRGNVYLLDGASGSIRAVLRSARGGSDLLWEPVTRTLWTHAYDEWAAFPIREILAAARQQRPHQPAAVHTLAAGRGGDRGFPLVSGAFARVTQDGRGTVVELHRSPGAVPHAVVLGTGTVQVSPNGRKLLSMPQGPDSRTVVIRDVQ